LTDKDIFLLIADSTCSLGWAKTLVAARGSAIPQSSAGQAVESMNAETSDSGIEKPQASHIIESRNLRQAKCAPTHRDKILAPASSKTVFTAFPDAACPQ
jgi:hypothetical protein